MRAILCGAREVSNPSDHSFYFDPNEPKRPLEFDDPGADDNEPVKGIVMGEIRAWHDQIERLREVLSPFIKMRDQIPSEMAKIIHKELDDITPIHLTVTKGQFMDAWLLWSAMLERSL